MPINDTEAAKVRIRSHIKHWFSRGKPVLWLILKINLAGSPNDMMEEYFGERKNQARAFSQTRPGHYILSPAT
jgi:hypothetical protein